MSKKRIKPKGTKIHLEGSTPLIVPEDFKPTKQTLRQEDDKPKDDEKVQ